ncbi:MAG: response regulator [Desulfobacterales bacterium]|nr:response regulator [Desulfobacterales bacterium]
MKKDNSYHMDADKLLARIDYLEENRRFIQNVLETALTLGDFQENINKGYGPEHILQEADKRIINLIPFEANAHYIVDQEKSDFTLSVCNQNPLKEFLQDEVDHMIEKGYFAWAIREKRGVLISSSDHSRRFVLHVIATYSRIRGMFIGLLPDKNHKIPDTSLTLLSIILLNTANALESLEFYSLLRNQNETLEKMVEERTQTLAQYERQLQQVLKIQAIGTLAGGIAHDFNNILAPIMGYTDMALLKSKETDPVYKDLQHVLTAARRAKDLVEQILLFSKQTEKERQPLKMQKLVKEALKLLRPSIPSTIEIRQRIDASCAKIQGDATQIHQVIVNLCTNAWQAMEEKGGILTIKLKQVIVNASTAKLYPNLNEADYACLSVIDTGCGMDEETLDRIFEPFFTTKALNKGTGLGLSVVHGIIRSHQGDILVYSEPGKGTEFNVYLPTVTAEAETVEAKSNVIEEGSEYIMIVDDEPAIAKMVKEMLENFGYKAEVYYSGLAAIKVFKQKPDKYDLLISDLTMPQMTGLDLADQLHKADPELPILIMTGFSDKLNSATQKKYGIKQVIGKPIVVKDLAETVRKVLDK